MEVRIFGGVVLVGKEHVNRGIKWQGLANRENVGNIDTEGKHLIADGLCCRRTCSFSVAPAS